MRTKTTKKEFDKKTSLEKPPQGKRFTQKLKNLNLPSKSKLSVGVLLLILAALLVFSIFRLSQLQSQIEKLSTEKSSVEQALEGTKEELSELKSQNQVKINAKLSQTIESIEDTYDKAVSSYEELLKLRENYGVL